MINHGLGAAGVGNQDKEIVSLGGSGDHTLHHWVDLRRYRDFETKKLDFGIQRHGAGVALPKEINLTGSHNLLNHGAQCLGVDLIPHLGKGRDAGVKQFWRKGLDIVFSIDCTVDKAGTGRQSQGKL